MTPHSFVHIGVRYLCVATLFLATVASIQAKEPTDKRNKQGINARVAGTPTYAVLNINNVTTWMRNDGHSNHSPAYDDGMYFPRGTGSVIFQDNIVWGGKAFTNAGLTTPAPRQLIRVGGGTYSVGTRAGRVLDPSLGSAAGSGVEDPAAPGTRIWRIRRDYFSMTDADLAQDAAVVNEIAESAVSESQKSSVLAQYAVDWNDWPVPKGAPFIERNGVPGYQAPPPFGPGFTVDSLIAGRYDEPGVAGADPDHPADQVIWTVYNDLHYLTTQSFVGSEPMGLEVQKTVWGYRRTDELENVYFSRYRIINTGGIDVDAATGDQFGAFWIDSMYVCQWSDPDVGDAGDDLVGCDTLLSLGYAFNSNNIDAEFRKFNLIPPAVGYIYVAGPLVDAPGDSGIFDLRRVPGKMNLKMSSFGFYSAGSPYQDPPQGYSNYLTGTGRWWKLLRGFAPLGDLHSSDQPYEHPPGMSISRFPLSGDPVIQNGFIDGLATSFSYPPGDRRLLMNSGPFRMAPGDTNEFVLATVAGMGADRLSSITLMRSLARLSKDVYQGLWSQFPPTVEATMEFPPEGDPFVRLMATTTKPHPVAVEIKGRSSNGNLLFWADLFDDGAHDDGASGDGVFGATAPVPPGVNPLTMLHVTWEFGGGALFTTVKEVQISILPAPRMTAVIVSDNLNNDALANRGENVRVGVTFSPTPHILSAVMVRSLWDAPDEIMIGQVDSVGGSSRPYDPMDPMSYLSVDIPAWHAESSLVVPVRITDQARNSWTSELSIPVEVRPMEVLASPVTKVQGLVPGLFGILRVDPALIKSHTYRIEGSYDTVQQRSFITVRDMDEGGAVVLADHEIPDSLGHNMPLIDGFKIVRGSVVVGEKGLIPGAWTWDGARFMTWLNADGLGFEEFSGAWGWATPQHFLLGGPDNRTAASGLVSMRILFAQHGTDTTGPAGVNGGGDLFDTADDDTASYAYRYVRGAGLGPLQPWFNIVNIAGGGYVYQDYRISAPLAAFDIDANPPQRLAVGYMENNHANGLVDGWYWPAYHGAVPGGNNTTSSGPREWLWIFNAPYSGPTPDAAYQTTITATSSHPVMYFGTWNRLTKDPWPPGNALTLIPHRQVSSDDVWSFNPSITGIGHAGSEVPGSYRVDQNYPNPFNPSTTIRYSLPMDARVSLRVYNVLGQLVETIVQAEQSAGIREITWDAGRYPSGLYLYRLDARGVDGSSFTKAMKMMLVK